MSAGTFASNPEYFDDVVFSPAPPSEPTKSPPPLSSSGMPKIGSPLDAHEREGTKCDAHGGSNGGFGVKSDYYNCLPTKATDQNTILERQTSQV